MRGRRNAARGFVQGSDGRPFEVARVPVLQMPAIPAGVMEIIRRGEVQGWSNDRINRSLRDAGFQKRNVERRRPTPDADEVRRKAEAMRGLRERLKRYEAAQ